MERLKIIPKNVRGFSNLLHFSNKYYCKNSVHKQSVDTVNGIENTPVFSIGVGKDTILTLSSSKYVYSLEEAQGGILVDILLLDEDNNALPYLNVPVIEFIENTEYILEEFQENKIRGFNDDGTRPLLLFPEEPRIYKLQAAFYGEFQYGGSEVKYGNCVSNMINIVVGNINITLESDKSVISYGEYYTLSGKVTSSENEPLADTTVYLSYGDPTFGTIFAEVVTDDKGEFKYYSQANAEGGLTEIVAFIGTIQDGYAYYDDENTVSVEVYFEKATISMNCDYDLAYVGQRVPYTILVRDHNGNPASNAPITIAVNGVRNVEKTNNEGIINTSYLGDSTGSVTITASAGSVSDSINLSFNEPIINNISLVNEINTIQSQHTANFIATVSASNNLGEIPVLGKDVNFYSTNKYYTGSDFQGDIPFADANNNGLHIIIPNSDVLDPTVYLKNNNYEFHEGTIIEFDITSQYMNVSKFFTMQFRNKANNMVRCTIDGKGHWKIICNTEGIKTFKNGNLIESGNGVTGEYNIELYIKGSPPDFTINNFKVFEKHPPELIVYEDTVSTTDRRTYYINNSNTVMYFIAPPPMHAAERYYYNVIRTSLNSTPNYVEIVKSVSKCSKFTFSIDVRAELRTPTNGGYNWFVGVVNDKNNPTKGVLGGLYSTGVCIREFGTPDSKTQNGLPDTEKWFNYLLNYEDGLLQFKITDLTDGTIYYSDSKEVNIDFEPYFVLMNNYCRSTHDIDNIHIEYEGATITNNQGQCMITSNLDNNEFLEVIAESNLILSNNSKINNS